MLSKFNSYFDPELCIDGHYIITGRTNDQFCNDMMELTDILPELHRYLRYEQGFDAVFFMDMFNMLFCFDQQSMSILRTAPESLDETDTELEEELEEISAIGPMGECWYFDDDEEEEEGETAPQQIGILNFGRMSIEQAWQQVRGVMHKTRLRCALVFSNANTMRVNQDVLLELPSFYSVNHPVVIYIFRESDVNTLENWTQSNLLAQRINAKEPELNRVITLLTPNEREIRNLLNHIRFGTEFNIRVAPGDIFFLSDILAGVCARKKWGLVNLLNRLKIHADSHPNAVLSKDSWPEFTEDTSYLTPMEELEALKGLEDLKKELRTWVALQKRNGQQREESVSASRFAPIARFNKRNIGFGLNVCLMGPPGTGKTTIARIMGRFYYDLGLLPQGHFIESNVGDLVRGGRGAENISRAVHQAMGGVLFIDEAYAFLNTPTGVEALNQLVAEISRYEGQFAVIIAGYQNRMEELLRENEGLERRFPQVYHLSNYSYRDMRDIFFLMAKKDPDNITFSPEFMERSDDFFMSWVSGKGHNWGNAGEAQNLLLTMKKRASARISLEPFATKKNSGICLTLQDIPDNIRHCANPLINDLGIALKAIDGMIGLKGVKHFLHTLVQRIRLGADEEKVPGNFIFEGPPGTGKTTVARMLGELLGLLHVLKRRTNNVVECRAADLLNGSVNLTDAVADARGGVFFLDEAHQLTDRPEGRAIARELVPLIEDPEIHADTCFICAGYNYEMNRFLDLDVGLHRRFPKQNRIRFANYSAKELTNILKEMAEKSGQNPTDSYLQRSRFALQKYLENREQNFGNGGFIRDTFLPLSIEARTRRLTKKLTGSEEGIPTEEDALRLTEKDKTDLTAHDLPKSFAELAGPIGRKLIFDEDMVMDKIKKLQGKDELVEYAESFTAETPGNVFYDETVNVGLNIAILGPVGCGKHTAIKLLTHLWHSLGMLENDEVKCLSKGDLEAGWVGQTAGKTREIIEKNLGGTIVIEFPSSMLPHNQSDNTFGPEALGNVYGEMIAHAGDTAFVILDTEEGFELLQKELPYFAGIVNRVFKLEDLTPVQMLNIFHEKVDNSYHFDDELERLLPDFFLNWVNDRGGLGEASDSWGNGSEVDRFIERLKVNWLNAGSKVRNTTVVEDGKELIIPKRYITCSQIPDNLKKYLKQTTLVDGTAMKELNSIVGLDRAKHSIHLIKLRIERFGKEHTKPGCYLFLGHPGVGKTMVAKLMGGVLKAAGVLSQGHVVVRTARQMSQDFRNFDKTLKLAKNGILFIDEAHQLAENSLGDEVIKRLLTVLEDDEVTDNTCIILAGYPIHMLHMLKMDPGLQSRFGSEDSRIYFDNYNLEQLMDIMDYMAKRAPSYSAIGVLDPLILSEKFKAVSKTVFELVLSTKDLDFGNARFVRTYLHDAVNEMLLRFEKEYGKGGKPPKDLENALTENDVPSRYMKIIKRPEPKKVNEFLLSENVNTDRMPEITEMNYDEVCALYSESVVLIDCISNGAHCGYGTGYIVSENGMVISCRHVLNEDEFDEFKVRVNTPGAVGSDIQWFDAEILRPSFKDCDMGMLKIKGNHFKPLSIRPEDEPINSGERTLILGYPLGSKPTSGNVDNLKISHFDGRIASIQEVKSGIQRVYIDSSGLNGNSGSPVFSCADGRVIGVFSGSIYKDKESKDEMNYFHPISYFWDKFF